MKKLIIANWKMNPQTGKEARQIFDLLTKNLKLITNNKKLKNTEMVVCPPFVYLNNAFNFKLLTLNFKLGAQDVFWEEKGAFTGEISAAMLKDLKCVHVIVGHSERRRYLGETDEMVNKKLLAALKVGLNVILCVGEHHRENHNEIPVAVEEQVKAALANAPKSALDKITVAYEPVWAIGTGIPDTPEGAMMAAVLIRKTAIGILGLSAKNLRVIYGGSVNSENAGSFINHEGIDGVLVGGASLDSQEFAKIIGSAII